MILEEEVKGLNIANLEVEEIKHWAATVTQQIANSGIRRQVSNLFQALRSRSIIWGGGRVQNPFVTKAVKTVMTGGTSGTA